MKFLFILNDPPYGTERTYNALRLAGTLCPQEGVEVKAFLLGDAVGAAKSGQSVPTGHYNLERMVGSILRHRAVVGVCGTCIDARGIREGDLIEGVRRSSMDELGAWSLEAEKVLTF